MFDNMCWGVEFDNVAFFESLHGIKAREHIYLPFHWEAYQHLKSKWYYILEGSHICRDNIYFQYMLCMVWLNVYSMVTFDQIATQIIVMWFYDWHAIYSSYRKAIQWRIRSHYFESKSLFLLLASTIAVICSNISNSIVNWKSTDIGR